MSPESSREHACSAQMLPFAGSAQIAMPSPLRSNHLRKKGGQKTTTLQRPAPAAECSSKQLNNGNANISTATKTAATAAAATKTSNAATTKAATVRRRPLSGAGTGKKNRNNYSNSSSRSNGNSNRDPRNSATRKDMFQPLQHKRARKQHRNGFTSSGSNKQLSETR